MSYVETVERVEVKSYIIQCDGECLTPPSEDHNPEGWYTLRKKSKSGTADEVRHFCGLPCIVAWMEKGFGVGW